VDEKWGIVILKARIFYIRTTNLDTTKLLHHQLRYQDQHLTYFGQPSEELEKQTSKELPII